MTAIFVDTSGFYAILDRDDLNHARARAVWARILPQSKLITNNYVIVETTALMQRRIGLAALRVFVNDILPLVEVAWVTEASHRAALDVVLTSGKKDISLVDCVSFQTMRNAGIDKVFGFDAHFRQQGFVLL